MEHKFIVVPSNFNVEDDDFFTHNPQLAYVNPVPRLIKEVGPELASKVMWAMFFTFDPDSKFFAMREEERKVQVAKNVIGEVGFDWGMYNYLSEKYPDMCMSKKKRRFQRLDRKFDQMLNEVEADDLTVSMAFYGKLEGMYKGLKRAEDAYEDEKARATQSRGDQQSGLFGKKSN